MKIKLQNRNAGYRLFRLLLPFLLAFGGMVVLVALVRSEALAQGIERQFERSRLPLSPQDSGVDLSVTKTHATPLIIGQVSTYTIFVKNVGTAPLNTPYTVIVTDTLPIPSLAYQMYQGSGWSCNVVTPTIGCTYLGTQPLNSETLLPPLYIAIKVKQSSNHSFNNIVVVSDTVGTNNSFSDPTVITTNLSIIKSIFPTTPVTPTRVVTFTLAVKNNGPNDTTDVRVTDTLPNILTFNGAKPPGQYNPTSGLWSVGNLAKDEIKTLVITATVKDGTCGQAYANVVQGLTSDLVDPVSSDNTATTVFTVTNTCVIGKVIRSDNSNPIQNAKVQVKDSLNQVFTTTTAADGAFTITKSSVFPLAAGNAIFQASAIGFRPKTTSPTPLQPNIKNGPIVIALDPIAQLDIRKSDGTMYIVPGETITYTIPITNLGVLNARNLVISDVLDSQLTFITYTLKDKNGKIPHTAPNPVNRVYTWTLSSSYLLTATEKLTLALRVRLADPLASGTNQIDNKVYLQYNEDNATRISKTATDFSYTPNFEIVQNSVSPTEAKLNERFTFSFRVYNRQPQVAATNVVFTNTFPSSLSFYSSSPSGSYNNSSRVFSVDLGTISPNSFKDVQIVMTVSSVDSFTQTFNNTASARFEHGGKRQWRSSNTVQYRILASSTLPGTGFGPPAIVQEGKGLSNLQSWLVYSFLPSPLRRGVGGEGIFSSPLGRGVRGEGFQSIFDFPIAFWVALGIGVILLGAGLLAIAYSRSSRETEWSTWARQMGIVLALASLLFFGGAWWIGQTVEPSAVAVVLPTPTQTAMPQANQPDVPIFPPPEWWDAQHKQLPNYPIPTPTLTPEQAAAAVDDTPPTRLLIPKLGVDAVVKYVPFDGFSWLISGLQNEVAWMGSTSWPGLGSNTGLAGHVTLRNGADGPFRYLETLQKGDLIRLYTQEGLYTYRVQESLVVKDDDLSVVQPTQEAMLTLITCTSWNNDFGRYLERLVVHARLEKSQPLSGVNPSKWPVWGSGSVDGN